MLCFHNMKKMAKKSLALSKLFCIFCIMIRLIQICYKIYFSIIAFCLYLDRI